TSAQAQSMVQASKSQNGGAAITVWLRGGNYFRPSSSALTAPLLTFTPADSGSSGQLISWAAYVNPSTGVAESPVISGGTPLTGFVPSFGSVFAASAGSTHFRQLYIQQWDSTLRQLTNQTKLTRARFPAANVQDFTIFLPV